MRRVVLGSALAVTLVVAAALPAWAHVTISADDATQGGFAKLTLRVPNEQDNANTVKIDMQIPADHPFASFSVQPKQGWSVDVKKTALATPVTDDDGNTVREAVSEVTWSGGQIKPGEFDEFSISVGPLPDVDSLKFATIQSYDNGQDIAWIEDPPAGGGEAAHPAPVLQLTAANKSDSSASGSTASSSSPSVAAGPSVTTVKKETNNGLAIAALIVGALGLVIGTFALTRRQS